MATHEGGGTQTAVVGTEHSLFTNTNAKTFVLYVDLSNMENNDELELRCKLEVLNAAGRKSFLIGRYAHAPLADGKLAMSLPVVSGGRTNGIEFTLKQTAGTGRNFDWEVVSV